MAASQRPGLAVPASGAYRLSLAGVPRPAAVFVGDGGARLVRRRATPDGSPRLEAHDRERANLRSAGSKTRGAAAGASEGRRAMTIEAYLRTMQATFSPERARGRHAVLQYYFTGSQEGACYAVVEDGTLRVGQGEHPAPTAAISADFDLWMRILAYEEDGLLSYQDGKYTVTGDVETLMESDAWFVRPVAR